MFKNIDISHRLFTTTMTLALGVTTYNIYTIVRDIRIERKAEAEKALDIQAIRNAAHNLNQKVAAGAFADKTAYDMAKYFDQEVKF